MIERLPWLDILRGLALVCMILFHLNYSLVHIFFSEILNFSEYFWYILWRAAAITFIFVAWVSYYLAEKKYGDQIYKKYLRYALILALFAIIISLWTYFFFPEQLIVFGILHFFALSFLLLPYMTRVFWKSTFLLGGVIILYGIFFISTVENSYLFALGWHTRDFFSADYYPLFPWFGVLLLGYSFWIFLEKYSFQWVFSFWRSDSWVQKFLRFFGKNTLLVYLIHQPLIIAILFFFQIFWIL